MIFDSHAHLTDTRFENDLDRIINDFDGFILAPGCNIDDSAKSVELAGEYDKIYAAVGIHPHDAKDVAGDYIQILKQMLNENKVVAIGEIGLDYHYDFSPREAQKEVFNKQLELAKETNFPVIMHMRESTGDFLQIVKEFGISGVMHCFSGSLETAKICLDLGLYISFSGSVTFNNANKLREVAEYVPLNRIMAETDCPYLAPQSKRGKRNEPEYVKYVLETIACVKNISYEKAARHTFENAKKLFDARESK